MIKDDSIIKNGYQLFWRGYLSNWYPSPFVLESVSYSCMEQFMMAEKARIFKDTATWTKIMNTSIPKEQKDLGRQVSNYNEEVWSNCRFDIVSKGIVQKFKQNQELLEMFLDTGNNILVEASPYDTVWGIGMSVNDDGAFEPSKWKGQNLLGKALMAARGCWEQMWVLQLKEVKEIENKIQKIADLIYEVFPYPVVSGPE